MTKLSVIVPCYNVSKYLNACVDSLIDAKVDSMEIVLVNDGSTDNTLDICNEYKKKYPKLIKVIDKKNGGLSDARNVGIDKSKGDYISFVDSDDTVEKDLYTKVIDKIDSGDYEIIVFGENRIFSDHTIKVSSGVNIECKDQEDIKKIMPYIYPAACNKIYKRELFDKVKFKKGIWYEDVEFIYRLLPLVSKLTYIDGYYYNYYQREGSITYTYNSKLYDLVDNLNGLVDYYKNNHLYHEYHDELEYFYVRYSYATFIKRLAKMKDRREYNKGVNTVISNVNKYFPSYRDNKYLVGKKGLYLKCFNKLVAMAVYMIEKNRMN